MPRPLLAAVAALVAAAAAPSALAAGPATLTTVELSTARDADVVVSGSGRRFTLVGLHWRGRGRVAFRTRSLRGRWSGWRPAAPEAEDAPDVGSGEARTSAGWQIGNPWWVGPSDRIEVRTSGVVQDVRAHLVWSPPFGVPFRTPAAARTPAIVPRASWGANESIRRAPPVYASTLRFAVVHHTAGRNGYTRAEAPAIVKAIQLYHVRGNGWNDIGYNFLVDRFGTVYEGRYGGVDKNVIGAHAQGFNTGSAGIALLGTYGNAAPSRAAQDALAQLIAWRLDVAHVDPLSKLTALSSGNPRYPVNHAVTLRVVSGHRDTGPTECPGNGLYARLADIGDAASRIGGPKIFEPRAEASAEGLVRFRARLSSSLSWAVSVASGAREVARGVGSGKTVDWTWDAASAPPATYRWSITASSARPATGTVRAGTATTQLAINEVSATPTGITPNGDGQGDTAAVSFALTTPANVSVELVDGTGTVAAVVLDRVWKRAGKHAVTVGGATLADGYYDVVIRAYTAASSEVSKTVPLAVSRVLGLVSVTPDLFSPNGDGRRDRLSVRFALVGPAVATVRILREGRWVWTPLAETSLGTGSHGISWDGSRSTGQLRDGSYTAVVEVTDELGTTVSYGMPFVSDTTPARLRILPGRPLRISVSEPAMLKLWVNGEVVRRAVKRPGTVRVRWHEPVRKARVVAWDLAGNLSAPVVRVFGPATGRQ